MNYQLTAGGKSDAEIATPTNELVLLPRTESATPMPLGKAMARPTMRPELVPRPAISPVGQPKNGP